MHGEPVNPSTGSGRTEAIPFVVNLSNHERLIRSQPLCGRGISVILSLALIVLLACAPTPAGLVSVLRVIDGDTIVVAGDARVRYIGVDTPEVGERCAPEATGLNNDLVAGKRVRLEKDVSETDRYGRLLRYVWVDDALVNAELVRLGYARAVAYPPDTKHQATLARLQSEAQAAQRGMWASGPCPEP